MSVGSFLDHNLAQVLLGLGSTALTGSPVFGLLPGLLIDRKRIYRQQGVTGDNVPGLGNSAVNFWNDLTGKTNTFAQNSAASALQEDAQAFNAEEAQKERDWQEYMSNTAVQRQAADLQAAGFNPALAAGAGASSGVAASASSSAGNPQASNVSALQSIANTAITAGMLIKIFKTLAK